MLGDPPCSLTIDAWMVCPGREARTGVRNQHRSFEPIAGTSDNEIVRSNAIRHTVDALASRGDEGRDKLR
jgi:hypothetical protein